MVHNLGITMKNLYKGKNVMIQYGKILPAFLLFLMYAVVLHNPSYPASIRCQELSLWLNLYFLGSEVQYLMDIHLCPYNTVNGS